MTAVSLEPGAVKSFYLKMSNVDVLEVEQYNGLVVESEDGMVDAMDGYEGLKMYVGRGVSIIVVVFDIRYWLSTRVGSKFFDACQVVWQRFCPPQFKCISVRSRLQSLSLADGLPVSTMVLF